ncbi:RNA-directed DNA polymerase, eukaryota [Tanacetum coccineum]
MVNSFLSLLSFSSLGELEVDAVTLLKRIRKFSMAQDIGARAAVHIFNRISFTIAKEWIGLRCGFASQSTQNTETKLIRHAGIVAFAPTFDDALYVFDTSMKTKLLSNPSEIAAPKLIKKMEDIYFTWVTKNAESTIFLSPRQMALWKYQREDHTLDWLRAVPISGLRQTMNARSRVFVGDIYRDHAVSFEFGLWISVGKEVDIRLDEGMTDHYVQHICFFTRGMEVLIRCGGNSSFDYAFSSSLDNSRDIPTLFVKDNITSSDNFLAVMGTWVPSSSKLLIISVYAPQDLTEKRVLWDYILHLIDRWDGDCVIIGDFNEVRTEHERYGLIFNVQGENAFNCFISLAGLIDLPLDGYAYTWAHKTVNKMSKLDRFLVSKGLVPSFPCLSALCLERNLSDHHPILMRELSIDYGPTLFIIFHSWMALTKWLSLEQQADLERNISNEEIKSAI